MRTELPLILQLDLAANPVEWISYQDTAILYAKNRIGWEAAPTEVTLHGGTSRMTGEQTTMLINTIIAVRPESGRLSEKQIKNAMRVPLTNKVLFRRDHHMCAYCGHEYSDGQLSRDHVIPQSQKGPNRWTNVVTACRGCNKYKDNRTPEEAGMELLYVPYKPNRAEYLILKNRKILADQMEFLLARVTPNSRLL